MIKRNYVKTFQGFKNKNISKNNSINFGAIHNKFIFDRSNNLITPNGVRM